AKLGGKVQRGAPLFAVEATGVEQAADDLVAAGAALKTARAQLPQAARHRKRAPQVYRAKGGALKGCRQSQTDLTTAQSTARSRAARRRRGDVGREGAVKRCVDGCRRSAKGRRRMGQGRSTIRRCRCEHAGEIARVFAVRLRIDPGALDQRQDLEQDEPLRV